MNKQKWILIASVLGSSLAFMDSTIVNVILPKIQSEFSAEFSSVQWIVEGYSLTIATLILTGGALGDIYGIKRIFGLGVIIFSVFSLLCGLAMSIAQLNIFRIFQGIGASLLIPSSLALISSEYSTETRGKAIGTWSAFSALTGALGPLLGGFLTDFISWRLSFIINLPIAVFVLYLVTKKLPENKILDSSKKIDWAGTFIITLAILGIVFSFLEAPRYGFAHHYIYIPLTLGILFLGIFYLIEKKIKYPLVPLDAFKSKAFLNINIITFLIYAALFNFVFFFPFCLIQLYGYSSFEAGLSMLPFIAFMVILSRKMGDLSTKIQINILIGTGIILAATGFFLISFLDKSSEYFSLFLPAIALMGLGFSIIVSPLTNFVMSSVIKKHQGFASGINNSVSRCGAVIAVAVFGFVAQNYYQQTIESKVTKLQISKNTREVINKQKNKMSGFDFREIEKNDKVKVKDLVQESSLSSFAYIIRLSIVLFAISLLLNFLYIKKSDG